MSKNLIPQIAEMLGIELGEEFKVGNNSVKYWFDLDGLHSEECVTADYTLYHLVCGNCKIVKLPWKPKAGDEYYSFGCARKEWFVRKQQWTNHPLDLALLDKGWVYRSKEEAEAALPAVAKEMGVEYEL